MTDDDAERPALYDFASDPDGVTMDDATPSDWLLDAILEFVLGDNDDNEKNSIGLVLNVNGALVAGQAIARTVWLREQVALIPESGKALGEFISVLGERMGEKVAQRRAQRDAEGRPNVARNFLHMREVDIHAGDTHVSVPFYRVRVDNIDGWSFGGTSA